MSGGRSSLLAQRLIPLVVAILVLAAGVACLLGTPSWIAIAVGIAPWVVVSRRQRGLPLGLSWVLIAALWLILVTMMATWKFHLPMMATVLVVTMAVGLVGCAVWFLRAPAFPIGVERSTVFTWIPVLAGPAVWLVTIAASTIVPGASRFGWVMASDSANNLLFARQIIYSGGIAIGPSENPVPLPTALLALVMSSGRGSVSSDDLLRHDISAFVSVWTILLALVCLLCGVLALQVARMRTAKRTVLGVVGAAGSLVPLSWFFTTYPLAFGFISTHVALLIVLCCTIAAVALRSDPRASFTVQTLAATLLLAVWSPLVAIPAVLALVILVASPRSLVPRRPGWSWVPALGLVQLIVYGVKVVIPGFLNLQGFLKAPGGVFDFPHLMLPIVAAIAVALALAAFWRHQRVVFWVVAGAGVGAVLGLCGLLFLTRKLPDPWTYYPTKYAWTASLSLVVIVIGLIPAAFGRLLERALFRRVAVILVTVLVGVVIVAVPPSTTSYAWRQPSVWILGGFVGATGTGDSAAQKVLAEGDLKHPALYWQSGDPDQYFINFWLLEVAANSMTQRNALRVASYGGYRESRIGDLCSLMKELGGGVTVHTANTSLEGQIEGTCPSSGARVVLVR